MKNRSERGELIATTVFGMVWFFSVAGLWFGSAVADHQTKKAMQKAGIPDAKIAQVMEEPTYQPSVKPSGVMPVVIKEKRYKAKRIGEFFR